MKICPDCHATYDDDAEVCAADGTALLDAEEVDGAAPAAPIPDVVKVNPDDATSIVDLEAMEEQFKARAAVRQQEEAAREADRLAQVARLDPDATGTLHLDDVGSKTGTGTMPADRAVTGEMPAVEATQITRRPSRTDVIAPPKKKASSIFVVVGIIAGAFFTLSVIVGVLWFVFGPSSGPMLTVTSVPPGAMVLVDGKEEGQAPLQTRVKLGTHTIELQLAGYEPFKEVVNVPDDGMRFLQPLKAIAGYVPPAAPATGADGGTAEEAVGDAGSPVAAKEGDATQRADLLAGAAQRLIGDGKFDEAMTKIKELMKAAPDDDRADGLLEELVAAKGGGSKGETAGKGKGQSKGKGKGKRNTRRDVDRDEPAVRVAIPKDPAERKAAARAAYQEGERLFKNNQLSQAKRKFQESIQLNSKLYFPHRSIARIYQRQGNTKKARYHLKRYLRLGGPDPDLKVANWLEQNAQ